MVVSDIFVPKIIKIW